jgi:hypothetical protein
VVRRENGDHGARNFAPQGFHHRQHGLRVRDIAIDGDEAGVAASD